MARPNQEAIETFMSIAGVAEAAAIHKLEEHGGNLNEAVNAYFNEGERHRVQGPAFGGAQNDAMDIDDPIEGGWRAPPFPLLSSGRNYNPFGLLDPATGTGIIDGGPGIVSRSHLVSHPREVREIPIEVRDGNGQSGRSGVAPTIENVTGTTQAQGHEIHGTVIFDDDDYENIPTARAVPASEQTALNTRPTAPVIDEFPDYNNDIEEEMIRAAIEASKRDAERMDLQSETAEREIALQELEGQVGVSGLVALPDVKDHGILSHPPNERLHAGSTSVPDEDVEDMEEQPLVRHRSRPTSVGSVETGRDAEETNVSPQLSPVHHDNNVNAPEVNGSEFHEWGGISSEEHDEAVMLEAAMFGGVPDQSGYRLPFAPHHLMQNGLNQGSASYAPRAPRPPSPSLTAQRLLREQQDDEYLAALQADQERELKAKEEAEALLAEERQKEEELRKKMDEEQEIDRQIAAKEASLPDEPPSDNENAITLLVRMPDGNRRGRRFLKSDRLKCLYDFIDVSRAVKPGKYRLVRPFPRRAFSEDECSSSLSDLGLTSKQEALFLELI